MKITKDTRVSTILEEYGDIADVMEVLGDLGNQPPNAAMKGDANLTDVKIDGDTATAKLEQTLGGQKLSSTIAFKKIDGEWKIDQTPGGM